MKKIIIVLFFLFTQIPNLFSQNQEKWLQGYISFVTKKNIYVKFEKTNNIQVGDSLFFKTNSGFVPALFIEIKSSVSILCTSISNMKFTKGQNIYAKIRIKEKTENVVVSNENKNFEVVAKESIYEKEDVSLPTPKLRGRFTVATNSNLGDYSNNVGNHRFRYIFSMKGDNIKNSKFYFDHYISFNQTYNPDFTHSEKINDKLRFYRITFGYQNKNYDISFGRQIKNKISALGSFDGVYVDKQIKNDFYVGALTGFRPDYSNYGFNSDLFQYGAFISYFPDYKKSSTRGTIAFFEQKNTGIVDRRFLYTQFSTSFSKSIRFFGASEIDLYRINNGVVNNSPKITNIYGNLSFRFSKKVNFSLGFDSRKNRIYYETYKDFLETLIERETRQGLRFRIGYRPFRKVSFSIMSNIRFKDKVLSSKYYNAMVFFRSIPFIKSNISLSANLINTNYLDSKSITFRLSKRIKKRITFRIDYKYYQYFYPGTKTSRNQNRVGGSLNFTVYNYLQQS